MKVVFIEDVPDVALAGQTKEVADGYGRNYLLPKKLAVLANSAASNILQAQMKKVIVKRAQLAAEMTEIASGINGVEITLKAKVGESERLYGSITTAMIAEELNKLTGQEIDKRKIILDEPIRQLGSHDVTVAFTHDITAEIKVMVEPEQVEEEKEEKPERKPRAKKADAAEGIDAQAEELAEEIEQTEVPLEESPEEKIAEAELPAEEPVAEVAVEAEAAVAEPVTEEEKPAKKPKAKKTKKAEKAEAEAAGPDAEESVVAEEDMADKEKEPGE